MQNHKRRSRLIIIVLAVILVGAGLVYAFWPKPMLVDIGEVTRGTLTVTIHEEGRTRVHDAYVISTPVMGRLLRVDVQPGDEVVAGETVVARMLPTSPTVLDARTREQARAAVDAAAAALKASQSDLNLAKSDLDIQVEEYNRALQLLNRDLLSESQLDQAQRKVFAAQAQRDSAEAVVSMREAELANARAQLISFDDPTITAAGTEDTEELIELKAPASGRILQVLQQSETTLPAGTQIMEIGNIDKDLEITVDLLSTDAVRVSAGDRVIIENFGADRTLNGVVERVDPSGFSKYSALGVEEQRVKAVIGFTDPPEERGNLGHGFRVEVEIVISEQNGATLVPTGALFRQGEDWAVFKVVDGVASIQVITLGENNGLEASVTGGLEPGDQIVLYPSSGLTDGAEVEQRQTG
ncbi:MAG: HlyD family efflux transporter periplasmic adaptor subunit [Hyphomicrobiaceae bacterium]|nr:HlyD family efflux transporter periplasmic adaptor subunit [Hyphomicrobiaceae bacterium]